MPKHNWTLLLQCVLVGKAQEVYSSLTFDKSTDYHTVKAAILQAYERVLEAYRQYFRSHFKGEKQTYVEFAWEKDILFDRWCASQRVETKEQLQQLILLEEFKNCVPEVVSTYLSEQSAKTVEDAAVLADEYVLAHKATFSPTLRLRLIQLHRDLIFPVRFPMVIPLPVLLLRTFQALKMLQIGFVSIARSQAIL